MSRRINQSISLTPELLGFIQNLVASGRYQTASEVVRDALRLLQQHGSAESDGEATIGFSAGDNGSWDD